MNIHLLLVVRAHNFCSFDSIFPLLYIKKYIKYFFYFKIKIKKEPSPQGSEKASYINYVTAYIHTFSLPTTPRSRIILIMCRRLFLFIFCSIFNLTVQS